MRATGRFYECSPAVNPESMTLERCAAEPRLPLLTFPCESDTLQIDKQESLHKVQE